jgi:hypothetical protein
MAVMNQIIGNAKMPDAPARQSHRGIASSGADRAAALAAVLPYLSCDLSNSGEPWHDDAGISGRASTIMGQS